MRGLYNFMKKRPFISVLTVILIILALCLNILNKQQATTPVSDKLPDTESVSTQGKFSKTENKEYEPASGTVPQESSGNLQETHIINEEPYCINESGTTVCERIIVPDGFRRVEVPEGSFGEYLRNLKLKPHGSDVLYYDGKVKPVKSHVAVLDMDIGNRDLQQCADSVIRLRAEYLYAKGMYDKIHFNFTNGFNADFSKWMQGYGIKVEGNNTSWVRNPANSKEYGSFRKYLDLVFAYAGTLSLSLEMEKVELEQMQPGDVFIYGNTPGHCAIVMDMAENEETGEKIFILAQGFMPAQDIHILKNPANSGGNPWYSLDFGERLVTPEWTFTREQLMRFADET